jgi:hypothetical protein
VIEPGNGKRLKAFEDENVNLKKGHAERKLDEAGAAK